MIRQEQCNKVCRILDNVLANRPRERDSLIVATRKAFEALEGAKWIPCSERMPEEHEWVGTKRFGTTISDEVYVTFESPKGERFTEHIIFQNGKLPSFRQREIDAFCKGSVPIAWKPLPEPLEGEQNGKTD